MTWFDELDEQTQQQWRSRIAKGRMELSASVEETLAEPAIDEDMWEDDEDEEDDEVDNGDEEDVKDGTPVIDIEPVSSERTIIPPRLSLQTKPMVALLPASPTPPVSSTPSVVPVQANAAPSAVASDETREQNQQSHYTGQHTGVFSRLAQRLTSSLAAITTPFQPPVPTPQPPARETHIPMPSVQPQRYPDAGAQAGVEGRVERPEVAAPAIVRLLPASSLSQWEAPREPSAAGKQRPGYPTKVHLQAAPKGTAARPPANVRVKKEATSASHGHTEPIPMRKALSAARSAPPTVKIPIAYQSPVVEKASAAPVLPVPPDESISKVTTNGRLPAILAPEKKAGEPLHPLLPIAMFGSGSFEVGQEDAAVANQQIVGSSVVVVMLSSDPGPVVVQYISLQPGSGFTVHLSAPARTKATFNYVVFQG